MTNAMVLRPQNFDQLVRFSEMAASSQMVPRDYVGKPTNIMVAVQMGSEIGLAPMQALQNIAVINGRPSVWGDAMLALCKAHPAWGGIKEMIDGTDTDMVAVCEIHRKGDNPVISTFSVDDAKKANLWGKTGPWQQYPKRMLQMRARGFALRDAFPDALKGLISAEEARDIPPDDFKGPTITATVDPPEPVSTAPAPKRAPPPPTVTLADRLIEEIQTSSSPHAAAEIMMKYIGMAATEDELHEIAGDADVQKWRDSIRKASADDEDAIAKAFTKQFAEMNLGAANEPEPVE
jgi:hypothetical protein